MSLKRQGFPAGTSLNELAKEAQAFMLSRRKAWAGPFNTDEGRSCKDPWEINCRASLTDVQRRPNED
jgi:hypothetical protein